MIQGLLLAFLPIGHLRNLCRKLKIIKKGAFTIQLQGLITKSLAGFYYVQVGEDNYPAKPRGVMRHRQEKPQVGDQVTIQLEDNQDHHQATLLSIADRKNSLVRPPVANVDYAFVVMSLVEPNFSYNLMDHYLVSMASHQIQAIIILTKLDRLIDLVGKEQAMITVKEILDLYHKIGYSVIVKTSEDDLQAQMTAHMKTGIYIVMGQSGVGKSTLINGLLPQAAIETGPISDYLNRGKHTTRQVTLHAFEGAWLADTPGFSAIDFPNIEKEDLGVYFPEIHQASANCRFRGCLHRNEPDCGVKAALQDQNIAESRYQNYLMLLEKIEKRKPLYQKKGSQKR